MDSLASIPCEVVETSHMDHGLTEAQVEFALDQIRTGKAELLVGEFGPSFYIAKVQLPDTLPTAPCALRGPVVGDDPIDEKNVFYKTRGERPNESRMVDLPPTQTRTLTVISGGGTLVTMFGGPLAPREYGDPTMEGDATAITESYDFWAEHALSSQV